MLEIRPIASASAAKSYYRSPDYYVEGQELPAYWHGKAAELLGLAGAVDRRDFERLADNMHPRTLRTLTAARGERRVGYDFTFSVDKSVSVAYALGGDERIADAVRAAVNGTMAEIEREMQTRVRRKGADHDRPTGNMVWTDFLHTTSRPVGGWPDPQLHVHAVAFSLTFDHEEDQWKAGQFGALKTDSPYFQALFRARLAGGLQDLGYALEVNKGDFKLVGVPERVRTEFSRRTALIEKVAETMGVTRATTKATLGKMTREKKQEGQPWAGLVKRWEGRVSPAELDAVREAVASADIPLAREERDAEAVGYAVSHLTERRSVVDQRQVMTEALKFGLGAVTPEGIAAELSRPGLIRREVDGRTLISTQIVLSEEKRLLAFAVDGRGRCKPLAPRAKPDTFLTPSQSAAFRHVLRSPDRLMIVRGVAGAGKSTLLQALMPQVQVPWVVLAPSAEASRGVLRRDGFDAADTLAAFLGSKDMQRAVRGGMVVLDEASLAGGRDMARLVEAATQLNARVLLLGDRRQHKSVSRGSVLELLEDRAGLPVAEVGEIRRQAGSYRRAVELLAGGRVTDGFDALDQLGWVKDGGLVDDYLAALDEGKSALVVSPTHAAGDRVTAEIRERLRAEGRLTGGDHDLRQLVPLHYTAAELAEAKRKPEPGVVLTRFGAYRPDTLTLAAGDTIRLTAGGKSKDGHKVNNGAVYQVNGFTADGDMRLSNGWTLGADFGHLAHGYVATSHASQGRTVDRVLIDMTAANFPAVGREQFYVSVSRGRQQATVYTDNKPALREAIQRGDTRLLASDLVRQPKHAVRKRLKKYVAFLHKVINISRDAVRDKSMEQQYDGR